MTEIRKLRADEIEVRVAQVTSKGASLLLYKTARVDRAILNEVFGDLWQNDFKVIDGKMYGGIGVYNKDLKEWLWRWDCGVESNTEAEKGQASDCFKRAGFKWGIGVELYTSPFIWVNVETVENKGRYILKDRFLKFSVQHIAYKDNEISELVIVDEKGGTWFTWKAKGQAKPTKQKKETEKKESVKKETPKKENPAPAPSPSPVAEKPKEEKPSLKERYENCMKFLAAQKDKSFDLAETKTQAIVMRIQGILSELQEAGFAVQYKELNDLANSKLKKEIVEDI